MAADLADVAERARAIEANVARVVVGKAASVRLAMVGLLAQGHLLIEDVPGVGKTLLAKALARSIDCSVSRIQFTPDLLPSDVTGVTIYSPDTGEFEFKPGPIFANIVIGDEINRAGPKTQSALLEAMEERTVTIDGTTHELAPPFMVMATQNPIELEGTYPLPEAQRDRFLLRLTLGYPDPDAELQVLRTHGAGTDLSDLPTVADASQVAGMIRAVHQVTVTESLERYLIAVVRATRDHEHVELGASPRASLGMLRAGRAHAVLEGRTFVTPDDVKAIAPHLLPHRLIMRPEAQLAGRSPADAIAEILAGVPAPTE